MKPRITVLTLGVADLETSLAFYRDGLGLPTQGIVGREFEHGAVAFFDLEEVDEVMAKARRAGATIVKAAADTFYGGYAGYFSDPDGHLWEVVWNPANLPRDD